MKKCRNQAWQYLNAVSGRAKRYIVILLVVQICLGISSVFYALFLRDIVRRHIVGGANRTLISVFLPPRLHGPVGDRRLSAG